MVSLALSWTDLVERELRRLDCLILAIVGTTWRFASDKT